MLLLTHMKERDYYQRLGVKKGASPDKIRAAFRRLSRVNHPDNGGSKEEFQEIQEAYETLIDEDRRFLYDTHGTTQQQMNEAINKMTGFIINALAKKIKNERDIRNHVLSAVWEEMKEIQKNKDNVDTGTFLCSATIAEIEDNDSFFNKLTIRNIREKIVKNQAMSAKLEDMLKVLELVKLIIDRVSFKEKEPPPPPTTWQWTGNASNVATSGPGIFKIRIS